MDVDAEHLAIPETDYDVTFSVCLVFHYPGSGASLTSNSSHVPLDAIFWTQADRVQHAIYQWNWYVLYFWGLFFYSNLISFTWTCAVTVSVTKEGIQFSCDGDVGSGSVTVKPSNDSIDEEDEENQTVIHLNAPASVLLSTKYLNEFAKATPLSKSVCYTLIPPTHWF